MSKPSNNEESIMSKAKRYIGFNESSNVTDDGENQSMLNKISSRVQDTFEVEKDYKTFF